MRASRRLSFLIAAMLALVPQTRAPAGDSPTTKPADAREQMRQRIARFIYELESPDADVREKASDELLAIGPAVIPQLKAALADDPTPELRIRAQQLLEEIPRQWKSVSPDGGEICAGFQALLTAAKPAFPAGGEMLLNVEMRNVGPRTRKLVDIRAVDIELPDQKRSFTSKQADARLTIRLVSGGPLPNSATPLVYDQGPPRAISFKTGGVLATGIRLDHAVALPAGEYDVQFIYYAATHSLLADAMEDLRSNVVRIKMENAPRGE